MNIIRAKISDLKEITELILDCSKRFILGSFSEAGMRAYTESHSEKRMTERLQKFSYKVLEAEDGRIVGVVGMQPPSHLYHLHVAPDLHGKGWGRKLWEAAKHDALERGKIKTFTVNTSAYAVPFYQKLGFVPSSSETKNGVTYVPMAMLT